MRAGHGQDLLGRVAACRNAGKLLRNAHVSDLGRPIDASLVLVEGVKFNACICSDAIARRTSVSGIVDAGHFGVDFKEAADSNRCGLECLTHVFFDNLVAGHGGELHAVLAAEQVKHRAAEEREQRGSLVLVQLHGLVALATRVERELLADLVAAIVFGFDRVSRKRSELGVHKVPVASGVGFFGPQELVANQSHLAVTQGVENFFKNLFVVAPHCKTAYGHRIVLGLAAVVCNLYGHAQVEFVLYRSFDATLAQCFGVGDGHVVALPNGNAKNLRGQGIGNHDACLHGVHDTVVVQADFQMQVRVSDTGAAREGQRVALLVACICLDRDVVLLGCILFLDNLVVKLAEAALVSECPGLAAVALEEHQLSVVERGNSQFYNFAVFGRVNGPAFFHLSGVVKACVVTRAAVLAKARGQVSVAVERAVSWFVCFENSLFRHAVGVIDFVRIGACAEVVVRYCFAGFGLDAVFVSEGIHGLFIAFGGEGGRH